MFSVSIQFISLQGFDLELGIGGRWEGQGEAVEHQENTIEISMQRHPLIRWDHNSSEGHPV